MLLVLSREKISRLCQQCWRQSPRHSLKSECHNAAISHTCAHAHKHIHMHTYCTHTQSCMLPASISLLREVIMFGSHHNNSLLLLSRTCPAVITVKIYTFNRLARGARYGRGNHPFPAASQGCCRAKALGGGERKC